MRNKSLLIFIALIFAATTLYCRTWWGWGGRRGPYRRHSPLGLSLIVASSSQSNKITKDDYNKLVNSINNLARQVKQIGDRVDEIEHKLEQI